MRRRIRKIIQNPLKNPLSITELVKPPRGRRRILRYLLRLSLLGFAFLFIGIALVFAWFSKDLPGPNKILARSVPQTTRILDRNSELLYEAHGDEKRTIVKANEIPKVIKDATIAAEDKNFYKHHGVSFTGVMRAAYSNITNKKISQGGSTITQQYVKNAIPEVGKKRTLSRKIKELIITLELEQVYSKDDILAMYLNQIPYGNTAYGIESATKTYFNKSATKDGLSLDEAAFLAAIPQAPTKFSPWGSHTKELMDRRNWVLDRMVSLNMIKPEEAAEAKKTDTLAKLGKRRENIIAPHFVMYIRELLADKYGEDIVQEGGLQVTTTLDLKVQKMAEDAVSEQFPQISKSLGAKNASIVAVDPKTGQILAMVGSVDFFDTKNDGNVNVATSLRQPGSSFKPIVYATAFKDKYNPAFVLYDVPTDFGGGYKPDNYDGNTHGPVTMRQALANSLNIPAVKTISLVGVDKSINTAKDLGITSLTRGADFYGPPLVLGSGEVELLDLVGAYSVFANQGTKNNVTGIFKITNQKGDVLEEYKPDTGKEVIDKGVAFEISDILSDNGARSMVFGSRSKLYVPGHTVAAKSGTTSDYRDAWTLGYTPQIAAGVWVGNNNNIPLVKGGAGAMAAAPIWNAFMTKYLSNLPDTPFPTPDDVEKVTVDKLSNKLPGQSSPPDGRITDWFATWQKPKDYDNIHVSVKVCKSDGKLAPDNAPADQIEQRYFVNVHSEMPDKPNWEAPVRAYMSRFNIGSPPKEYCNLSVDTRPQVSITAPSNGQSISGIFNFSATASAPNGIKDVTFQIDGSAIATVSTAPYITTYNVIQLSSGNHTITAVASDQNGQTGQANTTFTTGGDSTDSGLQITNIRVAALSDNANISFSTSQTASGTLEYGDTQTLGKSMGFNAGTVHTVTLSNLDKNKTYYYKINATAGNSSASSSINSFTTAK